MFRGSAAGLARLCLAWAAIAAATVAALDPDPGPEPSGPLGRLDAGGVPAGLRASGPAGAVVGVLGRTDGPTTGHLWCAAASPDGRWVAAATLGESLRLYEVPSLRCAWERAGGASRVTALAFAADGRTVIAGDADGEVRRWDLDGSAATASFRAHPTAVQAVAESVDGRTLATAALGCVRLWHADGGGDPIEELPVPDCLVSAVAFSPDGRWLACGGGGPVEARLWRLGDGPARPGSELGGHDGRYVRAFAFSPDGSALASLDTEGVGIVHDLSGARLGAWRLGVPHCLRGAFAADGRHYLAVPGDGTVRVVRLRGPWSGP